MTSEDKKARAALSYVIPILKKLDLKWVITGGFACHVYGVNRPITDIDIDVDTSKESPVFALLMRELQSHITQPLEQLLDQNYDNYNFEITVDGIVIDICPMKEMKVFDSREGKYIGFYENGFPAFETIDFFGLQLPLLSKKLIIKNKEMLVWQRDSDRKDISGLRALL